MKIALVRPNITFFSLPKMLAMGVFVSAILGALAWFWMELLGFESSEIVGTFVGVIWFLLASWNWWVWKSKRKTSGTHRWFAGLMYVLYTCGYFWLAGVSFWSKMLIEPWNLAVVGFLFVLFTFFLALPFLNPPLAEKLYILQRAIDLKIVGCGGISIIGTAGMAGYWIQKALNGDSWMIFVAVLSPIVGLGMLQHQIFEVWQTRPWAKAGEE